MSHSNRRSVLKAVGGIATIGVGSLAGCSGSSDGGAATDGQNDTNGQSGGDSAAETLDIAATFGQEHPQVQLLNRWSDNLKEQTDGSLALNYVSIGGEEDHMSATSSGSIAGHGVAMTALTSSYGREYGFLEAPFVAEGWEHFQALMDEYVYGEDGFNSQLIEQANQRILGAAFRGLRGTTANKAVAAPADIEGVKMRLPEFETWVQSWEEIGAQATPVPYDELYQALQTGVVDASEGPIAQFVDSSLFEVQSHFSQTDHLLQTQNWVLNEDTWQGLDESEQQAMQESLDEAIQWANEETRSAAEELLTMVQEEHDVTVVSSEDVDQDAFRSAAQPQLEEFFANRWKPSLEDVQSLA
ncbi:TRAP transporter substrate-binding protein [Haloarcula sp. CBA1130]|uniref:TRAP transporter substrate-binding protein n=1 Tax=unclassified Haloarcula TaxID=2624677 RepID=UPI001245A126|nr:MULTISPECIES: TRAP transporter substrate-binding protein [unclassified Haloarcula]KAA9396333.1 TRAP transporter substrate-binding protein [Haloarcula sp. CBA1130]KAA9398314.1 TRAP transporter substrate-binding protein [Haloarcula sp. CBA1129]